MKNLLDAIPGLDFIIFYGSQLGQAKSIAEGLGDTSTTINLKSLVFQLNEIKDIDILKKINIPIVIISSTTGDGEAPENADKFFRKFRKKNLSSKILQSVTYSILGLGDTNFNNFCNCGKTIHRRFQELGATTFYPPAWVDDAVESDETIENWIRDLWPTLKQTLGIGTIDPFSTGEVIKLLPSTQAMPPLTLPPIPQPIIELKYYQNDTEIVTDSMSPPTPYPSIEGGIFTAEMTKAKVLTKTGSVKTTLEVTLTVTTTQDSVFEFEPGDAIGIICPNPSSEVVILLKRLGIQDKSEKQFEINQLTGAKGKVPIHLPRKSTLSAIFTNYVDIRTPPKKALLRLLAETAKNETEKNELLFLCSREGGSKYEEEIRFRSMSILDVLLKYSSTNPRIESLLEHLPRLVPRAYSIASSPLSSSSSFTVAFNLISIPESEGRKYKRNGICTGWLYEIAKDKGLLNVDPDDISESFKNISISDNTSTTVHFFKRKNHSFRLPIDTSSRIIMVGPGTGVAPFIGFLEHRYKQKQNGAKVGPISLYFGCRNRDKDYIYENKVEEAQNKGILTDLNVTFSRDPNQELKYVQDYMDKNRIKVVADLLDNDAYLYVCGDAKNMAKSVREKLISCIMSVKGVDEKEAMNELTNLVQSKKYLQDIWT